MEEVLNVSSTQHIFVLKILKLVCTLLHVLRAYPSKLSKCTRLPPRYFHFASIKPNKFDILKSGRSAKHYGESASTKCNINIIVIAEK